VPGTDDPNDTDPTGSTGSTDPSAADRPADHRPASELDPHELVALLEEYLLGRPTMTGPQVAERVGIPHELARERWRSLGFTAVPEGDVAFTEADVHALELTEQLRAFGLVDDDSEGALIRTVGRSLARLSEWQLTLLARSVDLETTDVDDLAATVSVITPLIEQVMNYVWRRHTLNAATRMLLAPSGGEEGPPMVVGFADIVGYTRRSRTLRQDELARLVDEFEEAALRIITDRGGRIIKTIGDEVLFVVDDPAQGAMAALELVERHLADEDFPRLRVGVAYGQVLARLGDVFGPTVNLASRLTSISRPGRVLVDRGMAEALEDNELFRLRRLRRTSVKGYRRLEPWQLRRPLGEDPEFASERLPGPASQFLAEHGRDLVRSVDEGEPRGQRSSGRERGE
jgi:adenylate cyclase